MSVVIVGGNERMERRYKDLCREFSCKAKVYTKKSGSLKDIGKPDLMVLFTDTVSHKMVRSAMSETKGQGVRIAHCRSSSMHALKDVLSEHIPAIAADV